MALYLNGKKIGNSVITNTQSAISNNISCVRGGSLPIQLTFNTADNIEVSEVMIACSPLSIERALNKTKFNEFYINISDEETAGFQAGFYKVSVIVKFNNNGSEEVYDKYFLDLFVQEDPNLDAVDQDTTITPSEETQVITLSKDAQRVSVTVLPIPDDYVKAPFEPKFQQLINGTLTEVTEEDLQGNTKVNDYAFYKQQYLTKVDLPNTVKEIGAFAFSNCINLKDLKLDNMVALGDDIIQNCPNLNLTYIQPTNTKITIKTFHNANGAYILAIGGILNKTFESTGFLSTTPKMKLLKFNEEVTLTGNLFNATGMPSGCIFDFPTTIQSINTISSDDVRFKFTVVRAVNPPILYASNSLSTTKPRFVPYESIEQYKIATNWSAKSNYIYPFVYNLNDLSNIDTSKYMKALHIIDKDAVSLDNYAIYNYDTQTKQWIKET